jgi:glucose-1-phosphate thymidylyltransferase
VQAVVLHGGQGTRLRPLTHTGPKQLLKVAGKPVSRWVLDHLRRSGVEEVIMILGDNFPSKVVDYYGDGSKFGVKVKYVYQGRARGLADAVYRVKDLVRDRFLVYLGDNIVLQDLSSLLSFRTSAWILLSKVPNPSRFGVAVVREGRVIKVVEKPKEPISDLALVGVYAFTQEVFEVIEGLRPSWRGELEITDAIQALLDSGREVGYSLVEGWWKDTGTPEDVLDANMTLLDQYGERKMEGIAEGSRVEGRVVVERGARVRNSVIRGPAVIGEGTVVDDSFVGPFTSIGDNCSLKRTEVENSVILDNVILEGISITDSILGQGCRVMRGGGGRGVHRLVLGENSWLSL